MVKAWAALPLAALEISERNTSEEVAWALVERALLPEARGTSASWLQIVTDGVSSEKRWPN